MDPNYEWCLTGEPCKKVGWLLQKEHSPKLGSDIISKNLDILRKNGYKFKEQDIVYPGYHVDILSELRALERH